MVVYIVFSMHPILGRHVQRVCARQKTSGYGPVCEKAEHQYVVVDVVVNVKVEVLVDVLVLVAVLVDVLVLVEVLVLVKVVQSL